MDKERLKVIKSALELIIALILANNTDKTSSKGLVNENGSGAKQLGEPFLP